MSGKIKVLVIGGIGFVGRHLVKLLVDSGACLLIRVVDKTVPAIAFLSPKHQEAFSNPTVQFMQGDMSRAATVDKAFTTEDGSKFTFVFNVCGESKYGQDEEAYQKKILDVVKAVGPKAAQHGVEKFVELSHAGIYDTIKKGTPDESAPLKPWTMQADYRLQAEQFLQAVPGLKLVILRPSIIYGIGDINGITPRLICARVYHHLNEKMKFLYNDDLRINTVHADDVARALWHAAINLPSGSVYNLSDRGNTTQGSLNSLIEQIFGIKTGFHSMAVNAAASMALKMTTEAVNDKHMQPWAEICEKHGIKNTPLTPYLDYELLHNKHYGADGTAIEKAGFTYLHPQMSADVLREQVDDFIALGLFPRW